jgi:inner membrane protein
MDTLTHGLSGALLGQAFRNKVKNVKPKTFLVVGIFASIFPDLDIVFRLFSSESYLANHRGITHSILLLPFWSYLVSLFLAYLFKNKVLFHKDWINESSTIKELQKEFFNLTIVSIIIHIVFDIITTYGTMLLSPLNNTRFEHGSVFIIDFWFSGIIILGLFVSWLSKQQKNIVATLFLLILSTYISFTQYLKYEAESFATSQLTLIDKNVSHYEISSHPRFLSPFSWNVVAFDPVEETYYSADFNLNDTPNNSNFWKKIPKWGEGEMSSNISKHAWFDKEFELFRQFIKVPSFYKIMKNDEKICAYFEDLRFSMAERENPFIFGLCVNKNGAKYRSQLINNQDVRLND